MNLCIPEAIKNILDKIESAGYEAYLVGGCVRDLIMGVAPHDFDITSSVSPKDLIKLFKKIIPTGIKHGTVTVIEDGHNVEITRMRVDGSYKDSRRPESVGFTDNVAADLSRRDFTVNAIAARLNASGNFDITDPCSGQADINNRIIKAVGDPKTRFSEDALRIMRAFRFAAALGFVIEKGTLDAAVKSAPGLQNISRERIFGELTKTLTSPAPEALDPLITSGGLDFLGVSRHHTLLPLKEIPPVRDIRFTAFCLLTGSDPAELCDALKTDKALKSQAAVMAPLLSAPLPRSAAKTKSVFSAVNPCYWGDIIFANMVLSGQQDKSLLNSVLKAIQNNEPIYISELKIDGDDLKLLGFTGNDVGKALHALLTAVHEAPELNSHSELLKLAKTLSFDD